jgi:hypothetical protein
MELTATSCSATSGGGFVSGEVMSGEFMSEGSVGAVHLGSVVDPLALRTLCQ